MVASDLLECFAAIVDAGGFSKAAAVLNITQPAVSQKIRRLETVVGRPVFQREMNEVRLTPEGAALLPHAQALVRSLRDIDLFLRSPGLQGSVRIGIAEDFSTGPLASVLGRFKRACPAVRLEIETGLSGLLSDRLARGDFDLVVSKRADPRQGGRVLWREPLAWVIAPDYRDLCRHRPLPLILHPRPSVTAEAVHSVLRAAGIESYVILTSPSINGLRAGVMAGLGVSAFGLGFVPAGLEVASAETSSLPSLPALEYGLERSDAPLSPAAAALADLIGGELPEPTR